MPWTQQRRFLNLATPLGDDKFLLLSFSGHEGISQLFHFHLDMLSEDQHFKGKEVLQQLTDKYIAQVDQITKAKEAEIMEV